MQKGNRIAVEWKIGPFPPTSWHEWLVEWLAVKTYDIPWIEDSLMIFGMYVG